MEDRPVRSTVDSLALEVDLAGEPLAEASSRCWPVAVTIDGDRSVCVIPSG
jgi:hypothetical protein